MRLGYEAIREYLTTQKIPKITIDDPALEQESGVFITIRQNSNLRGCIGTLTADSPLYLAVQNMAIAAATSDPRFYPLNLEDLPQISIKVAILSPLQRMGIDKIEIGKHGLLIIHQGRRGVLLPEVPVDRGWDKAEFLTHLCIKAGLDPQSIKNNPKLYGFTTIEFESSYKDIFKE
jgi:AmmeMemoRadiSam system protein A